MSSENRNSNERLALSGARPGRPWWRLHPSSIALALLVAAVVVFANAVGARVDSSGTQREYGWPWVYAERSVDVARAGFAGASLSAASGQRPGLHLAALLGNAGVGAGLVACAAAMAEWRRRRRRGLLQVTLRDAAAFVVLAAVACSCLAGDVHRSQRQRRSVSQLQHEAARDGGGVHPMWTYRAAWLWQRLWPDRAEPPWPYWPGDVAQLWIEGVDDDACYRRLAEFPHLRELTIRNAHLADADLAVLASLRGLRWLTISECRLRDDALRHLAHLPHLEYLNLSHNDLTDDGLRHLHALPALRELDISNTLVTDQGVEALQRAIAELQVWDD
jgi:Leucine-rich repeat (LRR) protein